MTEESREYTVFTVKNKAGEDVEMAVVEEFTYDGRQYAAAALVEGDTVNADGVYLYKIRLSDDDFTAEPITDMKEYEKISAVYLEMMGEEE